MTKAELVALVSQTTDLPKQDVERAIDKAVHVIKQSVNAGEPVFIRGFGSFIQKKRAEKKGRNISKGTTVIIPEHHIPAFKPSKQFTVGR